METVHPEQAHPSARPETGEVHIKLVALLAGKSDLIADA